MTFHFMQMECPERAAVELLERGAEVCADGVYWRSFAVRFHFRHGAWMQQEPWSVPTCVADMYSFTCYINAPWDAVITPAHIHVVTVVIGVNRCTPALKNMFAKHTNMLFWPVKD